MNKDQLRDAIKVLHPTGLTNRKGEAVDLDDARSKAILAHYASHPELHGWAIHHAVRDLQGFNTKGKGVRAPEHSPPKE